MATKVHIRAKVTDLYDFYYGTDENNACGARMEAGFNSPLKKPPSD
jgi:hypothetical protein